MAETRTVRWQWGGEKADAVFELLDITGLSISYSIDPPWGCMTIPAAKRTVKALQELIDIAEAK